jgi:hypothetical protein
MFRMCVLVCCVILVGAPARADDPKPMVPPMFPQLPPPGPKFPATVPPVPGQPPTKPDGERRLAVYWKDGKWADLLDWYGKEAGLTLASTVKPEKGTFTFTPSRDARFTIDEITDAINEVLEQHKMILVRRRMTFFIQSRDERIEPLRLRTELVDLDQLSRHEFASVVIPLTKVKAADLEGDVKKLVGPLGSAVVLDRGLLVQDFVANLRPIVKLVRAAEEKAPEPAKPAEKTYAIDFKAVAWEEVFAWYAKETGLKAKVKAEPKGAFTYNSKGRKFTVSEITDIFNEELVKQKILLFRSHKSFVVVDIEKLDPALVPAVELKDLATRGRTELVEVAIPIADLDLDEVADELKKLLTPLGAIVLAKGKWLVVRDTAGNIERIRSTLQACNVCPAVIGPVKPGARVIGLRMKDESWEDVFGVYEKLSGLKGEIKSKPKGTFTFEPAKRDQLFTLAEITDIINDELAKQKLVLIPNQKTFVVVSLEKKIDPKLIPVVELEDLGTRGKTEVVEVTIPVEIEVDDRITGIVTKFLTRVGEIRSVKGKSIVVCDEVENIPWIRAAIRPL